MASSWISSSIFTDIIDNIISYTASIGSISTLASICAISAIYRTAVSPCSTFTAGSCRY
jgi:hypothetical protein